MTTNDVRFFDRRWFPVAIVIGLLLGIANVLPNVWQRIDREYPFQGIEMMGTDQEFYYASRIREVRDGFPAIGSTYYAEYKDQPFVQPPLPEWIESATGSLLGLDTARTVIAVKVIFGLLLFLCMTAFCVLLSKRYAWSLLAVSALLFAGFFFSAPNTLFDVIVGNPTGAEFLRFSRLTNPLFSSTLFFLALSLYVYWIQQRTRGGLIGCGIATGLCFYAYPYAWSYLGLTYAFSCGFFLWQRDWKRLRGMGVLALLIAVVAAPYIVHQLGVSSHLDFPLITLRFVILHSREFIGGLWMFAFLALPLVALRSAVFQPLWIVAALSLAGFTAMNQHVLSGTKLMPLHYGWFYIQPLAVLCWILFLGPTLVGPILRRCSLSVKSVLFLLCIASSIFLGIRFQHESFMNARAYWGDAQKLSGVLGYLSTAVTPGIVTYSPEILLSELVAVYTSGDVYDAGNAPLCLCPDDRRLTPYYFRLWTEGVSVSDAKRDFFTKRKLEISSQLRGSYYREAFGAYDRIPDADIRTVLEGYEAYLQLSTDQKLSKYRLHYLAYRTGTVPQTAPMRELLGRAEKVFDDGNFMLWKLQVASSQ